MRQFNTLTGFLLSKSSNPTINDTVKLEGYSDKGDGGGALWKHNGVTGQAASKSPTDLSSNLLNDASGNQWAIVVGQVLDYSGTQWFPLPFGGAGVGAYIYDTTGWAKPAVSELINDLSQPYTFPTVAAFKASLIEFPDGKVIHLTDRGADFTKITGNTPTLDEDVIYSPSVNQSLTLSPILGALPISVLGATAADSTSAIQRAIALDSEVLIDISTTTIAPLDVPSNTEIIWKKGVSITNTSDTDVFIHSDDTINDSIKFTSPVLNGTALSATMYAFNIANVTNLEIYDGRIKECGNGIRIHTCVGAKIKRNKVYDGRKGCVTEGTSNFLEMEHNECYDNTVHGIQHLGGNDGSLLHNICHNNGDSGIAMNGATFFKMKVNYNNCFSNGGGAGSVLDQGINTHGVSDSQVIGNICTDNVSNGIDISGHSGSPLRAIYTQVKDNVCRDNGGAGLKVFTAAKILVNGNTLRGNNKNLVVQGAGGGSSLTVSGNYCYDTTDTSIRANIHINQADGVCYIHDNFVGEDDSIIANNFGLYLDAAVTGAVHLGYNNFDDCLNPKAVQMANDISTVELTNKNTYYSDEIDLSGAAFNMPVPLPQTPKYSFYNKVKIVYTEASSADAGVTIGLGDGTTVTKYATGTTEISKGVGSETTLTLNRRGRLDINTTPFFYCAAGKVGAGKVKIMFEYDPYLPVNF